MQRSRLSPEDARPMPIWEAPTSASGAARAALKKLKPGQHQQAPRGLDSLFKKQEPAWARLLGSMSSKEQAVALCLLLGTTVIIMAHMRRSHRRRASIGVTMPGGVTVTINLSEPSQLANLP